MPKTKRFQNLQKSVQLPTSGSSTLHGDDTLEATTQQPASLFQAATQHLAPSFQVMSEVPAPPIQSTPQQQTASVQATSKRPAVSFQAMSKQPASSFQGTSKQPTLSFKAMSKQPAPPLHNTSKQPEFQSMSKQPASSFQGTSKQPASSFQGTSKQPAPSFQAMSKQSASSFQGASKHPALSFKAMSKQPAPPLQNTSKQPEFQSMSKQAASSFQGTSKQPAPPLQGMSKQPTPSYQATSQQPTPFQAASQQPAPSFQATSQASYFVNPRPSRAPYKKHFRRESMHHWTVDVTDAEENIKKLRVKTREVLSLPRGDLIILDFDYKDRPIGEAQGLLAGLCGLLATDCSLFPISYEKWPDIPKTYFNDCFDNIIKPRFHFVTTEPIARRYVNQSLCKKWGASRQNLWHDFYDPLKTKKQIMNNVPVGIARDQWISFINYRFKEATQKMCIRNAENRRNQKCPHTGGSKPNSRRMAEMMAETGTMPGRGQLYITTHTKLNGAYVNEEAREICEQIELALSKSTVDESEPSPNDAIGKVLGKEHPGRVRCMGLGAAPSNTFRQTNLRAGGIRISSSNDAGCSSGCQVKYKKLLDTLEAYILMKEGTIPQQFAEIFGSPSSMPSDSSSEHISPMDVEGSSGNSNPKEYQ